jgi:hypothetical protein
VDAAVVELNALADPVGARAEDDDLLFRKRRRLVFLFVGRVEIGRLRFELTGAGVDDLPDGPDTLFFAPGSDLVLLEAGKPADPLVLES